MNNFLYPSFIHEIQVVMGMQIDQAGQNCF